MVPPGVRPAWPGMAIQPEQSSLCPPRVPPRSHLCEALTLSQTRKSARMRDSSGSAHSCKGKREEPGPRPWAIASAGRRQAV